MSKTKAPPSSAGSEAVGPEAKAVIAAINQAGIKSSDADRAAKTITANDLASFFPVVFCSMTGVALKVMNCIELLSGMSPGFSAAEQDEIYDAFKEFIQIHEQFIASVAGKHEIVAPLPCGMFIASCFLADKNCIGTFSLCVTALMPTRADEAKSQQESLDRSFTHAIGLFGP